MLSLSMLRSFNGTELLGIWFLLIVTSLLVSWLFDWLMQKTGIGVVAGTAATLLSLIAGMHMAERFIIVNWKREPIAMDLPLVIALVSLTVVITILGLSLMKRKFFDN